MQVDIRTETVTQIRQTFSHTARHIGGDKPASRYQEATYDLQPQVNFHYRPLWQPELEVYDRRRTKIEMKNWYALKDPRQYYYGAYTIARARQQDAMEKNIEFVDKRGLMRSLPEALRDRLIMALVPLRHLEWGANTNNCYITAYGWGTALTQATMYHTMDRLGLAQYVSRIGLLLDGNSGDSLARGKTLWMEDAAWQGLRKAVETLMVTEDCMEVFVAQNLVIDGLLYPLVYQHLDRLLSDEVGPVLSLLTEFMNNWYDETSRWVDAVIKTVATESEENRALLRSWILGWRGTVFAALQGYAAEVFGEHAETVLAQVSQSFNTRVEKIGVALAEKA